MASKWTVKPDEIKVDLVWNGEPFWIRIKKRLTTGEHRRTQIGGWRSVSTNRPRGSGPADPDATPEINIDWKVQGFTRAATYLIDWSLADDTDKKLPLTQDTIEALDPDVFELIENAITAHVTAMEEEKKATLAGVSKPSEIFP